MANQFSLIRRLSFLGLLCLLSFSAFSEEVDEDCVAKKIDLWTQATFATRGDTLIVQGQLVRLIGVIAPQIEKKQKLLQPGQPLAEVSQTFLNKLIANNGMEIGLEYGKKERDDFGRTLAHVYFRDGSNATERILAAGLGLAEIASPNNRHSTCYFRAEQRARDANIALWGVSEKYPQLNYPLAESSKLRPDDIGYRIIRGKVVLVDKSSRNIIINLDTTGIRIPKLYWKDFDYDAIKALNGKVIEVRGYAFQYKRAMFVSIDSPDDIDLLRAPQK